MALWPKTETDWELYGEAEALGAPMELLNSNLGRVKGYVKGKTHNYNLGKVNQVIVLNNNLYISIYRC